MALASSRSRDIALRAFSGSGALPHRRGNAMPRPPAPLKRQGAPLWAGFPQHQLELGKRSRGSYIETRSCRHGSPSKSLQGLPGSFQRQCHVSLTTTIRATGLAGLPSVCILRKRWTDAFDPVPPAERSMCGHGAVCLGREALRVCGGRPAPDTRVSPAPPGQGGGRHCGTAKRRSRTRHLCRLP